LKGVVDVFLNSIGNNCHDDSFPKGRTRGITQNAPETIVILPIISPAHEGGIKEVQYQQVKKLKLKLLEKQFSKTVRACQG
jgi:hypothetical protein